MNKRAATTFIIEKTLEYVHLNPECEGKTPSQERQNLTGDLTAEINQAQGSVTKLNNTSSQGLLFKSLFENRCIFNLSESIFRKEQSPTKSTEQNSSLFSFQQIEKADDPQQLNKSETINEQSDSETPKKGGLFSNLIDIQTIDFNREQSIFNFPSWRNPSNKNIGNGKISLFSSHTYEQEKSESQEEEQVVEVDPSKSQIRFDYVENCKIALKVKLLKYKKDDADVIENLWLSVLHDKVKETYYITISLPATQHIIFSGLLLAGRSKIRKLNVKDSFEILVASLTNDKPKKLQRNRLKLTIEMTAQDSAIKFMEKMTQIIESLQK